MNKAIKQKWVKALRSGRYTQGRGRLERIVDGERHNCCLGVLCRVLRFPFSGCHGRLDDAIAARARLSEAAENKLIAMNDDRRDSFAVIADYIEKEL